MYQLLYIYLGGVIALFMESIIQWLHPYEEPSTNETFAEAISAAVFWPLMAIIALAELIFRRHG